MKVPLSEEYSDEKLCQTPVGPENLHRPKDFVKQQAEKHSRKVGMVVDLTFTHKYYDGQKEFESHGVEYLKILTQGGGTEAPKKADLDMFAHKVTEFFAKSPDAWCAVHCTHGINRSGFFIVTFLVEHCKMGLKDALAAFAASRAPGIWDHNYIDQLYSRYLEGVRPGPEAYPAIPPWSKEKRKRDYDERRKKIIDLPKFANDRGGVWGRDGRDDADERRRKIIDLPKFANPERGPRGGPGPGPDEWERWGPGPGFDRGPPPGRGFGGRYDGPGWDGPPGDRCHFFDACFVAGWRCISLLRWCRCFVFWCLTRPLCCSWSVRARLIIG